MDDESGESMEPMEEVPLKGFGDLAFTITVYYSYSPRMSKVYCNRWLTTQVKPYEDTKKALAVSLGYRDVALPSLNDRSP